MQIIRDTSAINPEPSVATIVFLMEYMQDIAI